MKNITITVSEDVAKWARIYAARHDTSISGMMSEILREKMAAESLYSSAMERFLSKKPELLRQEGETFPDRDSLHER